MIFIGEKINSSIKSVFNAIENSDADFIKNLAKEQEKTGANYIDVNAGMFAEKEAEKLSWLIKTVSEATALPLCIDTPNATVIEQVMENYEGPKPIINSITLEENRFEPILKTVLKHKTSVIALCMDDNGMPETVEQRVDIAKRLVEKLTQNGVAENDIYIDPMISPISTSDEAGGLALDTIKKIRKELPNCHITCGLSNISFGLPARAYINRAFLVSAMVCGLDSAIINTLDKEIMSLYYATNTILGNDEYCCDYIEQYREGLFEK